MSDLDAIKATIFDYFDGIRLADRARLERAFAVDAGHMKSYLKGKDGTYSLNVRPMSEVIDGWAKGPPKPEMRGEILGINIYSPGAASVLFNYNDLFTDSFQLVKVEGQWRIVNKFYIAR